MFHTVRRTAEIIDHDFCATPRQLQGMTSAQPLACTGDNGHAAVVSNRHYSILN